MPYCTIEEAWGAKSNSTLSKTKSKNNYSQPQCSSNELQYAPFIKSNSPESVQSRNYTLLPEHSETEPRLAGLQNSTKKTNPSPSPIPRQYPSYPLNGEKIPVTPTGYSSDLAQENARLRQEVTDLRERLNVAPSRGVSPHTNDHLFDLLLFIFAGIFILFILDMITKSVRPEFNSFV